MELFLHYLGTIGSENNHSAYFEKTLKVIKEKFESYSPLNKNNIKLHNIT